MNVLLFKNNDVLDEWDNVVQSSMNGTFLHSQKFLSYHGDRFKDMSLIIRDENNRTIALFPAAEDPTDPQTVVSHPGITYGGLVAGLRCRGETVVKALQKLAYYYKEQGYTKLIYKAVPYIYHKQLFQDDLYALFRIGGSRYRCDISATIDLGNREKLTKGRKYEINKARKHACEVVKGAEFAVEIYETLVDNLQRQHNAKAIHTFEELLDLHQRFPDNIEFIAVKKDSAILAGLILFLSGRVVHTQYIASRPEAHKFGALDFMIETAVRDAMEKGYKYFDFGISNESDGKVLNENLYRYKRSFGAGSVVHEFYEIDLEEAL